MATARKTSSGRWKVRVYDYTDGDKKKHYRSFTGDTKKDAERKANTFTCGTKGTQNMTFGQAVDGYISLRESILSPRSIMDYRATRKNYIKTLEGLQVSRITQNHIQRCINDLSWKLSPKTVRNVHGLITATLRQYRPDFAVRTALPANTKAKLYIPSDADVKALIARVSGTDLELPVLLAAFGPMRRGEICALDTKNIKGNVVHVCENMVLTTEKKWTIKSPKSISGDRYIEYPEFISSRWSTIKGRITDLTPDALTCRFRRALKSSGLPFFRFHDLRHYCASVQHALGVPDAYIMQRGGWGNDGVLKEVYRHAMESRQREMNERANAFFTSEFSGQS